ncbi:NTP transferase domain-containing protein [uncultured Tateyamaria sp.]|uniref:nucleotidyltransferase family protein n=1 Tax=uncultured Tateyamaria sp. TaxID=455651 RepID=UPI002628D512|nr:NTP transferase domain-containing protein [uncultured Tateyamaria sp.]
MIPILIPAAGASSRMRGADKLLQEVDGVALLRRQAMMARTVSADVRIGLPPRPHSRYDALAGLEVTPIPVPDAGDGFGHTLRALFGSLEGGVNHAMLLLPDLPDIAEGDLRAVFGARSAVPDALIWRGATPDGQGGHPILINRAVFADFQQIKGDGGGRAIIRTLGDRVHHVAFGDDRARRDLDTPEAWAAWRAARPSTSGDPR